MANQYKPLWIDPFENILYSGWQNTQSAPTPVFKQGDKIDIELFLVKRGITSSSQDEVEFPAGSTIRFAVGKLDTPPTAGTMVISYAGEQTGNIPHNASAAAIQTALNSVGSIASACGVVVSVVSSTIFRIAFEANGPRPAPLLDTTGLSPTSSGKVITARAGTSTLPAIYLFKVNQSVAVFQNNWVDSPQPTITETTLVANQTKRVTISPTPLSGTWTLDTTPSIDRLVEDAGDEDDVPTYWTQTVSSRLGAFTSSFLGEDGRPIWNMSVIQIGSTSWDFTVRNDYDVPVGYTMPFTVDGNFTKFPSKVATVNFDTVEVEYLLDGADSVTASLEIEVESPSGDKWTVLQTSCTIVNDLIDQATYSPLVLETPLQDAPSDGSLYARQDGAWVSFTEEDNQGITMATAAAFFAPIVHIHTISDVLNLQSELDGKADVSHNHNVFTLQGQNFDGAVDGDMVRIYNQSLFGGPPGNNLLISRPVTWWEYPRNGQPMPNLVFDATYQVDDGFGGFFEGTAQVIVSFSKYLNRLNTGYVTLNTQGINNPFTLSWTNGNTEGYYNFGSEYYGDTLNIEIAGSTGVYTSSTFSDSYEGVAVQVTNISGSPPSSLSWGQLIFVNTGLNYNFAPVRPTSMDEPVMKRGLLQSFIQELNRFRAFSFTPDANYPDYTLTWDSNTNKFVLSNILTQNIENVYNALSNYALKSGTTFTGKVSINAGSTTTPLNIGSGTTPAVTVAGDVWMASTTISYRDNSSIVRTMAVTNLTNTFTVPQIIATTSSATTPALRITNLGTSSFAHSLVVEDNTNPDSTSFIVTNAGVVGIQRDPAIWVPATGVALDVNGRGTFIANATYAGINIGSLASSPTTTTSGDVWIGNFNMFFRDHSGNIRTIPTLQTQNSFINSQVITNPTSGTLPTLRLTNTAVNTAVHSFVVEDATNPDTSSFVIDHAGNVGIGVNPATWVATQKFEVQGNIKFSDNSVQTTAYIPSAVAITGGTIDNVVIDGGTY